MTDPRQALVDAANSVTGWTAPDDNFLNLIAPGDDTTRQQVIAKESDCALTAMGIQEIVINVPVRGPYKEASAFPVMYTRACGNPWTPGGAMRLATLDAPPQLGDVVVYGDGPAPGKAPAHMETVTDATVNVSSMSLTCVAGGEKNSAGLETVKIMNRELTWRGGHWVDNANGRPIIGVVDAEILAGMYSLVNP